MCNIGLIRKHFVNQHHTVLICNVLLQKYYTLVQLQSMFIFDLKKILFMTFLTKAKIFIVILSHDSCFRCSLIWLNNFQVTIHVHFTKDIHTVPKKPKVAMYTLKVFVDFWAHFTVWYKTLKTPTFNSWKNKGWCEIRRTGNFPSIYDFISQWFD